MIRPPKPQTITLVLVPPKADDSDQTYRRLRALLKTAWRSFGLRCTSVAVDGATVTSDSITEGDE